MDGYGLNLPDNDLLYVFGRIQCAPTVTEGYQYRLSQPPSCRMLLITNHSHYSPYFFIINPLNAVG